MTDWIPGFFKAPVFTDENKTYTARLLYACLNLAWIYVLINCLILFTIPGVGYDALLPLLYILILFVLMALTRRGFVDTASAAFVLCSFFTVSAFSIYFSNPLQSMPYVAVTMLFLISASVLRGWKFLAVFTGIVSLTFLAMIYGESTGLIPLARVRVPASNDIVLLIVLMLYGGVFLSILSKNLHTAIKKSNLEAKGREAAEQNALKQSEDLRSVSKLSIQLGQAKPDDNIYETVTKSLIESTGALAVIVTMYDPSDSCLVLKSLSIQDGLVSSFRNAYGEFLEGFKTPISAADNAALMCHEAGRISSLSALSFGSIPEVVSSAIHSLFAIDAIYACTLRYEEELIGALTIIMPANAHPFPRRMLVALAHVVSVAIRRKQAEAELERVNRALRVTSACNQTLVRAEDEASLTRDICRIIVDLGKYAYVLIGLLDPDSSECAVSGVGSGVGTVVEYSQENGFSGQPDFSSAIKGLLCGFLHERGHDDTPIIIHAGDNPPEFAACARLALQFGYPSLLVFPLLIQDRLIGALSIYSTAANAFTDRAEIDLLAEMAGDLSFGIHTLRVRNEHHHNEVLLQQSKWDLETAYDATLEGWAQALELRERETAGHSRRVIDLTLRLAEALSVAPESMTPIRRGALLHDIGKMGIPDSILLKPGPLTPDEWVIMRQHPLYAGQFLKKVPYLVPAMDIPLYHHEHWDGGGYPYQLKGTEIPLAARIFAMADVWDALTSDRPYRPAWTEQAARSYLAEQSGKQFDPQIVPAFLLLLPK